MLGEEYDAPTPEFFLKNISRQSIIKNRNEAFTVTILSEKHICKSCLFVVEQFKARYPNATVNIVSGNPAHGESNSKGEMGMLHWKHR